MTDEGLAAMSECEDMTSALARELAEGIRHENAVEDIAASFRKMAVLHPEKEENKTEERETKPVPRPARRETPAVQPLEQLSFWALKYHGGVPKAELNNENLEALEKCNL